MVREQANLGAQEARATASGTPEQVANRPVTSTPATGADSAAVHTLVRPGERAMMRLVAELYYLRDQGQPAIAELTGFSVSKVSRLLAQARACGVVRISVEGATPDVAGPARELSNALGVDVRLTPGRETAPTVAARLCGVAAALHLADELPERGVFGLTGGYTIDALAGALPGLARPELVVVPLLGGWDATNPHLNSNEIARRVAERLGASVRMLHAPGLLDSETTTQALLGDSSISATTRLWESLDLALIGMSGGPRLRPGYGTVMDRLDEAGRERLAETGAVGDVAGHLVRLDGSLVQDEWERRTISISIPALQRARRVIGIAAGSNKIETIIGGARSGLLHLLITDEPTAVAALKRLEVDAGGGAATGRV